MKTTTRTLAMMAAALMTFAAWGADEAKPKSTAELKTDSDKISYAFGSDIGNSLNSLKKEGVEIDVKVFSLAIEDVLAGKTLALTQDEMKEVVTKFQQDMRAKQMEKSQQLGEKNLTEGKAFLEANGKKEGIKTLPSGLQYKVITTGTGPIAKLTDTVSANYRGTLIDGTEFDSSEKQGGPAKFPVTGVIKGWTEALQLMPVGSKWQIFVPGDLAYGANPRPGGPIGPNATLIFDIELVGIEKPAAADDGAVVIPSSGAGK